MRGGEFIFNNINFYEKRVRIQERPEIPKAERNITLIDIPGRNSPLTKWDGSYLPIEFELSLVLKATNPEQAIEEYNWITAQLQEPTYEMANFYFDPNYYYRVRFSEISLTYQTQYIEGVPFKAKVECSPIKFNLSGIYPQDVQNNSFLFNLSQVEAKPLIEFEGEGDVELNFNGNLFSFKELQDGKYGFDAEMGEVYQILDDKYLSIGTKYHSRELPILIKGQNAISWTGNIHQMQITPNWGAIV